jgi:hypothetical protein
MSDNLSIVYTFTFSNNQNKQFDLTLDRSTLSLKKTRAGAPPHWTLLHQHQCKICPLKAGSINCCPVAINMADIVEEFKEYLSHEHVHVTVTTEARTYSKETTLQEGLSALKGIIMVTSGCPVMEPLKPMVRFHLPFATMEETVFRMFATYLVAQYYRRHKGMTSDDSLEGLEKIYADVAGVNKCFANRLQEAARKDANINALVNLDCFAEMVPLSAEDLLAEIEPDFAAYF